MSNDYVNEIDQLLQEIESANDVKPTNVNKASRNSIPSEVKDDKPRKPSSSFSTYDLPNPSSVQTNNYSSSPKPRLPCGQKLVPLNSFSSSSPPSVSNKKSAGVSGGIIDMGSKGSSPHGEVSVKSGGVGVRGKSSSSGDIHRTESLPGAESVPVAVNFLPVMHARPIETNGISPKSRWGHTLTTVSDSLFLFGGTLNDGVVTNDLFEFSVTERSWEPVFPSSSPATASSPAGGQQLQGSEVTARSQHSAVEYLNRYLVIFGGSTRLSGVSAGQQQGTALLNDVQSFDTVSQCWTRLGLESYRHEPTNRFGHSAVVFDKKMYVFGGKCSRKNGGDSKGYVLSNDVNIFCLETNCWKKRIHLSDLPGGEGRVDEEDEFNGGGKEDKEKEKEKDASFRRPGSLAPAKRYNHAACIVGSTMFISGGEGTEGVLSDTWAIDLTSKEWRMVNDGVDAVPRCKHAMFGCGDSILALCGSSVQQGGRGLGVAGKEAPVSVMPVFYYDEQNSLTPLPNEASPFWISVTLGNGGAGLQSSKKNFAAAAHSGFIYMFGGNSATEPVANCVVTRLLAMDGIPASVTSLELLQQQMSRMLDDRLFADLLMVIDTDKIPANKLLLQSRSPKFYEELTQCRNETAGLEGRIPEYSLVGSNRVQGMSYPFTPRILRLFLHFLYCANLLSIDEMREGDSKSLAEVASRYEVPSLTRYLSLFSTPRSGQQTSSSSSSPSSSSPSYQLSGLLKGRSNEGLNQIRKELSDALNSLFQSGNGATATVLFTDPHTQNQSTQAVHPFILASASVLFRKLLKPLCVDNKPTVTVNGITAKKAVGGSTRRGIVIGPVSLPTPSIKHVLRFLYTCDMNVPPEAALPTMIGANAIGLWALRAHCESIVAREEVNFETACSYLLLAINHKATLLEELSLLTASLGYEEVRKTEIFPTLSPELQETIKRISQELQGHRSALNIKTTEQKNPEFYRNKLSST